jgi:hypothetical protein
MTKKGDGVNMIDITMKFSREEEYGRWVLHVNGWVLKEWHQVNKPSVRDVRGEVDTFRRSLEIYRSLMHEARVFDYVTNGVDGGIPEGFLD